MVRILQKALHLIRTPERIEIQSRAAAAFSRAAATAAARVVDPAQPLTWEFSGFSQHGEDGILDYLCTQMLEGNRFFIEIGASDGLQNCSAWLAFARRFGGVMVEGNPRLSKRCAKVLREMRCHNIVPVQAFVNREDLHRWIGACPCNDPDVFILDIDGIDYHIMEAVFARAKRPKVIVVEYNSAFGPERAITVPYNARFSRKTAHPSGLYYGASIAAWRALLGRHGYRFVTVDSNGVNAFFLRPECFPDGFADGLHGLPFQENLSDLNAATKPTWDWESGWGTPRRDWQRQFALIRDLDYNDVSGGA